VSTVRILIADDHAPLRSSLRSLISSYPGWSVCGEAADGIEAVQKTKTLRPDVVLMDISMPCLDGFQATSIIRREVPHAKVIVVSQNDISIISRQAVETGASAFVGKFDIGQALIPAIEKVLAAANGDSGLFSLKNQMVAAAPAWLSGDGEMAELIRATDWSQTPLGSPQTWSPALRMMVTFLLANRFPMLLWWGPQYIQIYNDAYSPILGVKHPKLALGQPVQECWHEIWHVLKPLIDTPYQGGTATWIEDLELEIKRFDFTEESHFTVAYSPVPDDTVPRGIGGVLATVHEITEKVIGERRIDILRQLGASATEGRSAEDACTIAADTLARHPKDFPFALLYLLDADRRHARLAATAGVDPASPVSPTVIAIEHDEAGSGWPIFDAVHSEEEMTDVDDLSARFEVVPSGPWSNPPHTAVIVPIHSNKAHDVAGLLICGVSARLALDSLYRAFLQLTAAQIATAIANAREYEEEKKRAEALRELDRAKTAFFSNVSHEFRTPLTLLIGPLEDALANVHGILPLGAATDLAISHRNALRLLKLVNTLLDFSRIEAGRVQASFYPTDLAAFTAELASNFRSACGKAGLRLLVDCPPLPQAVYVDRDMWEKITLNLISNAFKFTREGEIEIRLATALGNTVLTVRDTGVGIAPDEIPHMFERFHRVKETRGRTYEGTGIGLALVQELVKLHGGSVRVESEFGVGTTFTVTIPLGTAHLDASGICKPSELSSAGVISSTFIEEALRWLPSEPAGQMASSDIFGESSVSGTALGYRHVGMDQTVERGRVIWADDNADMRAYVERLLRDQFEVVAVADGEAALSAARERAPDLILSDVMMPRLDGFGLLRELRSDPQLREIPIILLSARAGEESRIQGVEAGADDYLVKPFSARELVARVEGHVKISRMRRETRRAIQESEERYRLLSEMLDVEVQDRTAELRQRTADVVEKTEQLRDLSKSLLTIQENERRHVARELHDSAGTILTVLSLTLAKAPGAARKSADDLQRVVEDTQKLVAQLGKELRTMSYLLHPPLLEESGLSAAVRWHVEGLTERSGLQVKINIPRDFPRLPPEMELMIFRLLQECLTNALRHSGSKSAEIRMKRDSGEVCVEVQDPGCGMSPERLGQVQLQGGVGIRGMRERLHHFGGKLTIQSAPSGTKISARIPHPAEVSAAPEAMPQPRAAN
jgi:signal transduction histidine kinase